MRVAIRADAALHMGSGHVMRCLALSNALKTKGADISFICRDFPGHFGDRIAAEGHQLNLLPPGIQAIKPEVDPTQVPPHTAWLGETWETDLAQTQAVLKGKLFDWLIVDHYSLDGRWENVMRKYSRKVMAIDDLADRSHDCDLLLDQTLGRSEERYNSQVPGHCVVLVGSKYALLRPEFPQWRDYSLKRRARPSLERLLVSFGGVDKTNATCQVLRALQDSSLPADCRIAVVMGETAPWLKEVRELAEKMKWPTEVKMNVPNMAQLMADSDLAIGAAGGTTWERCCLGLPAIMVVLATNQRDIGLKLEQQQAVILLDKISDLKEAVGLICDSTEKLANLSQTSRSITDGSGVETVLRSMEQLCA